MIQLRFLSLSSLRGCALTYTTLARQHRVLHQPCQRQWKYVAVIETNPFMSRSVMICYDCYDHVMMGIKHFRSFTHSQAEVQPVLCIPPCAHPGATFDWCHGRPPTSVGHWPAASPSAATAGTLRGAVALGRPEGSRPEGIKRHSWLQNLGLKASARFSVKLGYQV